jgi:hypothetical protein
MKPHQGTVIQETESSADLRWNVGSKEEGGVSLLLPFSMCSPAPPLVRLPGVDQSSSERVIPLIPQPETSSLCPWLMCSAVSQGWISAFVP